VRFLASVCVRICANPIDSRPIERVNQFLSLNLYLYLLLLRLHPLVLRGNRLYVFVLPWIFTTIRLLQVLLGDELEKALGAAGEVDL
jgi:hypothetical protein